MAKKSESTGSEQPKGTAMTVYKVSNFAALNGNEEFKEALAALAETGMELTPSDIPRIKFPSSGGTRWEVMQPDGEPDYVEEIGGAFLYMQKSSVLWPSFDPAPGTPPVLRSWDCKTADIFGEIPVEMQDEIAKYTLPNGKVNVSEADGFAYSQWDSGKNGIGKRMKESRMCFLLPPDEPFPVLVNVGVGSIKQFDPWFKRIVLQMKVHYTTTVVSFRLTKEKNKGGIDYSQLDPKVVGVMDKETREQLREQWYEPLSKLATQITPGDDGDGADNDSDAAPGEEAGPGDGPNDGDNF